MTSVGQSAARTLGGRKQSVRTARLPLCIWPADVQHDGTRTSLAYGARTGGHPVDTFPRANERSKNTLSLHPHICHWWCSVDSSCIAGGHFACDNPALISAARPRRTSFVAIWAGGRLDGQHQPAGRGYFLATPCAGNSRWWTRGGHVFFSKLRWSSPKRVVLPLRLHRHKATWKSATSSCSAQPAIRDCNSPSGCLACALPVGTWRSLVAHLHGVQGVASSNLAVPTNSATYICSGLALRPPFSR